MWFLNNTPPGVNQGLFIAGRFFSYTKRFNIRFSVFIFACFGVLLAGEGGKSRQAPILLDK